MDKPKEKRITGHFGPELNLDDLQPRPQDPRVKEIMERFETLMLRLEELRLRNG